MKVKQILITVLAASLIAVSACACGESSESDTATKDTVQITTAQSTTAASTTAASQSTTAAETTTEAQTTTAEQETTKAEESSSSESSAQTATNVITYITTYEEDGGSSSSAAASSSDSNTSASYSDSDASIVFKGYTVKMDGEFNSSSFGTPDAKQEVANCLTGGTGYAYVYGSVTINVYTSGGKEYVEAVLVEDASASTSKGITSGSSTSDLVKAYGDPSSSDSYVYSYDGSNTTAMFYVSGSSVTGVCFTKK